MRNFDQLTIFVAIARESSLTRAADALDLSKAAVSSALASLERRLGSRLIERTTRRLRLTESGETYLAFAQRALDEAEAGEVAVLRMSETPRGTIRLAMPVTFAQSAVAPALARFLRLYPELKIDVLLRGGQIDPVAERIDVAFQTMRPKADSRIIRKRFRQIQLGIYASPQYLHSAPPLRNPRDLAQHTCLTLTSARERTHWMLAQGGEAQEFRVSGRTAIGDPYIQQRLCLDGVGIAILPNWLTTENVQNNRLVRVLPAWSPKLLEIYLLYPSRLSMTPKLNAFLTFMDSAIPKA